MTATAPRRGEVRPISDLPDSADPTWVEVEDSDGTARRIPESDLGGSEPYPDDPNGYGVATVDDEEWNAATDLNRWTIESDVPAPHTREINGTFSPSRLAVNFTPTATSAYLSAYRAPTAVVLGGAYQLDFDASGAFSTAGGPGLLVGFGTRDSAAAASPGMLLCLTNGGLIELRKYSNIGTGTFTSVSSSNINNIIQPFRLFLHLERSGANYRYSWSQDAVGKGATDTLVVGAPLPAPTLEWLLIKRDAVGIPAKLASNWLRWNRYTL